MAIVKITNTSRFGILLYLGGLEEDYNANGVLVPTLKVKYRVLAGAWSRTSDQAYTLLGTELQDTQVYVLPHRFDWSGLTHARVDGVLYQIVDVAPDNQNGPTSCDLITLKRTDKRG